eukprot:TRINITY_DN9799_c0_g1_i1.p1 TRINITY_DN9799_c0_g1~~TRINITY_DN9799_c0_g1_i1.p1  ORF type:complete len:359 (-),score=51.21 TRINITY_DN9799_c0_g1_i1:36-1112(-)
MDISGTVSTPATKKKLSRLRVPACESCSHAKAACTEQRPCPRCTRLGIDCIDRVARKRGPKAKYAEFELSSESNAIIPYSSGFSSPLEWDYLSTNQYSVERQALLALGGTLSQWIQNSSKKNPSATFPGLPSPALALLHLVKRSAEFTTQNPMPELCPAKFRFIQRLGWNLVTSPFAKQLEEWDLLNFLLQDTATASQFDAAEPIGSPTEITDIQDADPVEFSMDVLPMPCIHFVVGGADGVVVTRAHANDAAAQFFGYTVRELERLIRRWRLVWWLSVIALEDWLLMMPTFMQKLGPGPEETTFSWRCRLARRDGSLMWTNSTLKFRCLPDGTPKSFTMIVIPLDGYQDNTQGCAQM